MESVHIKIEEILIILPIYTIPITLAYRRAWTASSLKRVIMESVHIKIEEILIVLPTRLDD